MEIYTLKEASRKAKIGIETLKRACEEGLIKATRLANGQWRVAESALSDALHHGLDLRNLTTPSRLLCTGRAFSRGEFERILQA